MEEYLKMWEQYVAENYDPKGMDRYKLEELYKIADIMKDMTEYWAYKDKREP